MAGILHDEGENRVLNILYEATAVENYELRLFTSPTIAPVETDAFAAFTEPSGNGYAVITLTRGTDWTITDDEAVAAQKTFTAAGGAWGNVYGYFTCVASSHEVMHSELFSDGPYNIVDGGSVKVTCKIKAA
jgi:hypothetical protein